MNHRAEFEAAVEAILFATTEPVSEQRLLEVFETSEAEEARSALDAVRARYAAGEHRGVRLEEVAGGLRLVTSPECHPYLRKYFDAAGANRLSMAGLETLAIVAYRQPVTGPEIQELRGKNPSAALHTLLERRMVRIAGRKEVVGRPFLYATTREFLMHFGLRSLSDLPPLEEFEETFAGADLGALGAAPVSQEHEAIGMVSSREAEASLGTGEFSVNEVGDALSAGRGGRSELGAAPDSAAERAAVGEREEP